MYIGRPVAGANLGFSLNPFHYVKKAVHDVAHPLDTAKSAATSVGHAIKTGVIKPFEWVASQVTAPIRNRVHKLRDRRAAKLAWDRRKSRTPNAQEKAEAKSWTKSHLKSQGPHGEVLQLFAGPMPMLLGASSAVALGDPATISLIAASIPVFMALMNSVLHKADASGQAPADPTKGAAPGGPPPPGAPGPDAGGGDAGAGGGDAGAGGDDSGAGGGGGKGGGGAKLLGMPKKYVIIGGAVLGGVVLLSLLSGPSKKG